MEQYAPTQSALEIENITANTTTLSYAEAPTFTEVDKLIITVFMPIVVTVGITGNIAIIIVFLRIKPMRTSMNIYLANLALADLMYLTNAPVTIWKVFAAGDLNEDSAISLFYCKLNTFLVDVSFHVSSLTILALTLERYFVVCWPLRFKTTNVRPIAIGATLCCWGVSFVWNSRKLAFTGFKHYRNMMHEGELVDITYCTYYSTRHPGEEILHTIDASLFFVVAVTIFILYFLMISMMQKMSRTQRTLSRSFMVKHRAQHKILRMLILTVTVYILCLSPFQVINLISIHGDLHPDAAGILINLCRCLLYINSAANPFIYNVFNIKYREAFVECFCSFPGKKLSRTYTRTNELSPRRTQTMLTKMNSNKSTTSNYNNN
ncbi:growth hormone secretagogue receptor type 1-like [Antedon mediterranea]|uniref:growth hormone secretagogue receptor type 1-like n=1 Tax=Antedon mediterranea TaxID=105859 RepID=UPI003AF92AF6